METKIIISYVLICITYTMCRLHYLLTQKTDEEFNTLLEELEELTEGENVVRNLVLVQFFFAPLMAPFSIMKLIFKRLIK